MKVLLPGLRGNDPLGFLAAVGLLSLSEQGEVPALTLSWGRSGSPAAEVDGEVASVEALAGELRAAFDRLRKEKRAIPGIPSDLPLGRPGSGKDPMRMSREQMQDLYRRVDGLWVEGDRWPVRWMTALSSQTALDKELRVKLTPFYAPTGQMAMRTSIFEKTMEAVDKVGGPGDALTGWRRTSYDGANFDERAKRDAGVTTYGKPANQGAPSPTWLAAIGMRFFPMTDDGRSIATVGWQGIRLYPPPYTTRSLIWPLWEPMLNPAAVRTLLAHPALLLSSSGEHVAPARPGVLAALGVTHVFGASRRTLSKGDGPLGPPRLIWSAPRRG